MADENSDKLEGTIRCIATLKKLRSQMTALKYLNMDGVEKSHIDTAVTHTDRIQSCLNTLLKNLQEKLDSNEQNIKAKRGNSRSIKP